MFKRISLSFITFLLATCISAAPTASDNATIDANLNIPRPICAGRAGPPGNRDEAYDCMDFLFARGEEWCGTGDSDMITFCQSGNTKVVGISLKAGTRSLCKDVALGLKIVVEFCCINNVQKICSGKGDTNGNGDLVVGVWAV
ncbi:hypothetical protein BT63DRAFT_461144 [Microthyrium microscopicum]|uniref:Cyanovirin-N domain-containing protein n=1 Tax=Microthyrium microscopicum TaxID=703497 RepID=A0A6A6TVD2_9PEZI|nr:hypothetical protein BT63DRAFT_461144 [Microthyrium microscopicum]